MFSLPTKVDYGSIKDHQKVVQVNLWDLTNSGVTWVFTLEEMFKPMNDG